MTLTEEATFEQGIYQIELSDPVIGGADGIANLQAKQLANRTNWLKAAFEKIVDGTTLIAKALKLATARKISLGGALSGSANFDGSADITIEASFANGVLTINSINGLSDALNGLTNAKQPLDTTLTALANLTTTANKLIYTTGSDTFATTDLTAFARTLLDDVDGVSMFVTMGTTQSLLANGYCKLPNGLIFQWGEYTNISTVTFPITFPNKCFQAVLAHAYSGSSNIAGVATVTPSNFTSIASVTMHRYFAIGY